MKFKNTPVALALLTALSSPYALAEESFNNENAEKEVERIIVTGSRIARVGLDTATPIVVVDAADIAISGDMNVNDFLATLPQFGKGTEQSTTYYNPTDAGLSAPDLRNLGVIRTMVLINGKRATETANSEGFFVSDLNQIPAKLIDRVEILTGGASAVYGSGAVAGVVNVILKKDYEGTSVDFQTNNVVDGGGDSNTFSITHGSNFDNGKGNFTVSAEYFKQNPLLFNERPGSWNETLYISNPADPYGRIPGVPNDIIGRDLGYPDYNLTRPTIASGSTGNFFQFTQNNDGSLRDGFLAIPDADLHDYYYVSGEENPYGFSSLANAQAITEYERATAYLSANYEFDNGIGLSGDIRYSRLSNKPEIDSEYIYPFSNWVNIYDDNGYEMPAAVVDLVESWEGTSDYDGGWFTQPFTFNEFGGRGGETDREFFSASLTLDGEFSNGWYWSAYASSGQTEKNELIQGKLDRRRFNSNYQLIGDCEDSNSCAIWNPFDTSQEVYDYLLIPDHTDKATTTSHTFEANISGELFSLPAGELMFSVGASVRREGLDIDPSIPSIEGWGENSEAALTADRNINEVYVEFIIPVLSEVMFAETLDIETAYRAADYTYAGRNDSWKFGLNWAIDENVRIRTEVSQAVRAPQLIELFQPSSTGWARNVDDPCDAMEIGRGDNPELRQANCLALGIPEGWEATETNTAGGVNRELTGNINLDVEEADTFTVGLVVTPSFIDNLNLTVDYYDIEIQGGISKAGVQTTMNECVDSSSIDNRYCDAVHRDDATQFINYVEDTYLNTSIETARGVDYGANYYLETSAGSLNFSLAATRLLENSFQETPLSSLEDEFDTINDPKWKSSFATTYNNAAFTASWRINYSSSVKIYDTATAETNEQHRVNSSTLHNLRLTYALEDSGAVYVGMNNVFDRTFYSHPSTGVGGGAYPIQGRIVYAGINYEF